MKSATFCPYPWIHLMTQPTGDVSYCCVAKGSLRKPDGTPFNVGRDSLSEIWNSSAMREVRKSMLSGEKVAACAHCYYQEEVGMKSYRQSYIEDWTKTNPLAPEILKCIEGSTRNDFRVESSPLYLDFRLGNSCNLKCRMCQPFNSSQLYSEYRQIQAVKPDFESFIKPYSWGSLGIKIPDWYNSDGFLETLDTWMPSIVKMYFTGGEPLLIPRVYWILNKAIELGVAENIEVVFNTNCVKVRPDFLELLSKFKKVILCASIDGHREVQEYIRYPSRWSVIENNLRLYAESPHIDVLMVTPVVQVYNVLDITALMSFVEEVIETTNRDVKFEMLILDYPEALDVRVLPEHVKALAAQRLEGWLKTSRRLVENPKFCADAQGVLNILRDSKIENAHRYLRDFVTYTKYFDEHRGVSLESAIPELYRLLCGNRKPVQLQAAPG